jgi:hypothetical protein
VTEPASSVGSIHRTTRIFGSTAVALVASIALVAVAPSQGWAAVGADGWSIIQGAPVADAWLEAAVAISSDDVWAVGTIVSDGPLAEHWDGTSWTRTPTHVRGWARFMGIAALGPRNVWAVGSHTINPSRSLIEHWNGARWRFVPSPLDDVHDQQLQGVYAVSQTDIWAVGYRGRHPLIEHWDGSMWHLANAPSPSNGGGLNSVTGSGPNDIWAVGFRGPEGWSPEFGTLIEHWNGSRWSIVRSPGAKSALSLNSVVTLGPNDAWAVGGLPRDLLYSPDSRGVSEHWDGHRWTKVPVAGGAQQVDTLNAVAVAPMGELWAVGEAYVGGCYCPLAERWDGQQWIDSLPVFVPPEDLLKGVIVSATDVWAVGIIYGTDQDPALPVIERRAVSP